MTTASNDTPGLDEMTDDQLDQALRDASANLLSRITATADSNRTLTAIMTLGDQPAETLVTVMIRLRDAAHDLASDVAQAPFPLSSEDSSQIKECIKGFCDSLIADNAPVPDLILQLGDDLTLPRELTYELEKALDTACELARLASRPSSAYAFAAILATAAVDDQSWGDEMQEAARIIAVLDDFLSLNLGPTDNLCLNTPLGPSGAWDANRDPDPASGLHKKETLWWFEKKKKDLADYVDRYVSLGRDMAADIRDALRSVHARALDQAQAIARHLESRELDASGEDLSGVTVRHLDALDRITWTRETTWPAAVADYVEDHSCEIRPGLYQVHFGDTKGRPALLALT
jgi:hypothetical protein